jgi:hypothetical protein
MTDEERDQLISAALDGERVNLEDLRAALASPAGGATAAEFILLRAAVSNDRDGAPGVAPPVAEAHRHPRQTWRLLSWPRIPAGIAASLLLAAAAASFWAGQSWRGPELDSAIPGPAVAVTTPAPQAAPKTGLATRPQAGDAVVAPTPARVLRFTPGVDWHEGS